MPAGEPDQEPGGRLGRCRISREQQTCDGRDRRDQWETGETAPATGLAVPDGRT